MMASHRKTRELAFVLPFLGLFLLLPPITGLFRHDIDLFGVPLIVVYIFGAWVLLIATAVVVARRLGTSEG